MRPTHWASWADSLRMVRQRHPVIAERMGLGLRVMILLLVFLQSDSVDKHSSMQVWRRPSGRCCRTAPLSVMKNLSLFQRFGWQQ